MNSTIGRSVLLGMGLTNPNNNRDQTVDTLSGHFLCGVAASPRVLAGSASASPVQRVQGRKHLFLHLLIFSHGACAGCAGYIYPFLTFFAEN